MTLSREQSLKLTEILRQKSKVIDVRYDGDSPMGRRWRVVVLSSGEVLYVFCLRSTARCVGKAVAIERGMRLFVRDRKGRIVERKNYRPGLGQPGQTFQE